MLQVRPTLVAAILGLALPHFACTPSSSSGSTFPPAQSSGAAHQGGQTFLTFDELAEVEGETFRVYRGGAAFGDQVPVTPPLRDEALHEGTGDFHSGRFIGPEGWRPRYLERYVVPDGSSGGGARVLEPEEGLFVWTVAGEDFGEVTCTGSVPGEEGCAWYAVTVVEDGVERVHATYGPVHERVAPPMPVEVTALIDPDLHAVTPGEHVFTQFMDLRSWNPTLQAPNAFNEYWGLPEPVTEAQRSQLAYAFNYVVFEPAADCECPRPGPAPIVLDLHGFGGLSGRVITDAYPDWCAWRLHAIDTMSTWWFGFAAGHDYRTGIDLAGVTGETIENFTEQRLLRAVLTLPAVFGAEQCDLERVYILGHSMGGGGALSLALRYPNVFAAVYAAMPITRYGAAEPVLTNAMSLIWGAPEQAFPIAIDAPNGLGEPLAEHVGTSVWEWQDHPLQAERRAAETMAPFGVITALDDQVLDWSEQSSPALAAFQVNRLAFGGVTRERGGHGWDGLGDSFSGLPPNLGLDPSCPSPSETPAHPFFDFRVTKSASVPGLSPAAGTEPELFAVNMDVEWSASWNPWDGPVVDEEARWSVSLRGTTAGGRFLDVTPRRAQSFVVEPLGFYMSECRSVVDGALHDAVMLQADADGLLSARGIWVPPAGDPSGGVRLSFEPFQLGVSKGGSVTVTGATPFAEQVLYRDDVPVARTIAGGDGRAELAAPAAEGSGGRLQVREGDSGKHWTNVLE